MIIRCDSCGGYYSGLRSHSHTSSDVVDQRFVNCRRCRGKGAMTCEKCKGTGRLKIEEDGSTSPAIEFARSQRTKTRTIKQKDDQK